VPRRATAVARRGDDEDKFVKPIHLTALAALALAASAAAASAAGDPAAGEARFKVCKVCHQVGENAKNFVGPELNGVVGRKAGTVPGYNYSDANKNSGLTWDEATFKEYITAPQKKIPGTKMTFPGLPNEADRDNVWAYLSQFKADGAK
jgi:cytochrome c